MPVPNSPPIFVPAGTPVRVNDRVYSWPMAAELATAGTGVAHRPRLPALSQGCSNHCECGWIDKGYTLTLPMAFCKQVQDGGGGQTRPFLMILMLSSIISRPSSIPLGPKPDPPRPFQISTSALTSLAIFPGHLRRFPSSARLIW